ncbi:MAG: alpha-galactosidase [Myxococcaceae bacterium]|nr:alpha-galactosidase [Myxococcaceae bacterium]
MRRVACVPVLLLAACAAPPAPAASVAIVTRAGTLTASPDGTLSLTRPDGLAVFTGAHADALLAGSPRALVAPSRCAVAHLAPAEVPPPADVAILGARDTLALRCEVSAEVAIDLYVQAHADSTALTARSRLRARRDLRVLRASPFVIDRDGGLYVAGPLADDRILDDGSLILADATVRLATGTQPRSALANAVPIPLRGNVIANSNLGLHDLGTGCGLALGFLTAEHGLVEVGLAPGATPRSDGAEGYGTVAADVVYFPNGKSLAAGAELWSEVLYLDPGAPSGSAALEGFADAVRDHLHVTPWQRRGGATPRRVPSAWQSWTLGFRGGYGHDVTSAIVRANVDAAARELVPYGFGIVPVDDGWQRAWGDWTPRPDAFPEGWAGEVAYAAARGLGGGFWVAPFTVERMSDTARQHPEWIASPEPTVGGLIVSGDRAVLDLSRDDVVARVRDVARQMNAAGLAWTKQDYAYQVLGTVPSDASMTSPEAFRRGWAAIRAETPDTTLLLAVGAFGPNFGVADAIRTGLDTGGRWDEGATDADNPLAATRSLKTTVRTASRRWYLNDRVTLLDPDAIPFRSMDVPPTIGDAEERTFTVFVAMLGGLVELGDPVVDLRPFALDAFRRLLPVYGEAARPLDVFVRDYNERWVLPVRPWSTDPDAPEAWVVAAATNWGRNRDWSATPPAAMPDAARRYRYTRDELGLGAGPLVAWELWSGRLLPVDDAGLTVEVAARESAVVTLRPRRDGVQFVGSDRHLTGGAPDVERARWDASAGVFTLGLRVAAAGDGGHTMRVRVALRADAGVAGVPTVTAEGAAVTELAVTREGELVTVAFTPGASGALTLRARFGG